MPDPTSTAKDAFAGLTADLERLKLEQKRLHVAREHLHTNIFENATKLGQAIHGQRGSALEDEYLDQMRHAQENQ